MTADAVKYMNNSAECLELQRVSFKQVAELNAEYTLPARQPDVDDAVCLYCVLRHIALLLSISLAQTLTNSRRLTRLRAEQLVCLYCEWRYTAVVPVGIYSLLSKRKRGCLCNLFYFAILHRQCLWSATLISLFHERCIHIAVVRSRRRWWGVLKMRKLRYAQIACQSGVECGEQFGLSALQGSSARSAVSVVQRSATLFHFSVLQREKAPQPFEQKKKGLPLQPLLFCDFAPSMLVVCYFDFIVS